ncbi:hypothetical protein JRQ81_014965 [Phrynocephalus forsythii]|uniref:Uncharacterized protein n=1 Tax=Phrynocephalus forsythii TaxID=171643 RepID=A0A9Q0XZN3_9SAUR|nr:hypothetical protein JRQ81_014965 [Phrynocephalus forsythii]
MASADGSQYGGLYEYKKHQEDAVALCSEDLLAVNKAGVLPVDYQEGEEKNLQGRLNGFSERTKERGDFPGMHIQYLGPGRTAATMLKPRPRPLPPTPTWTPSSHTQEQSGQMESVDQLNHPEQALLVVMKLVEALGKKGLHNEALYQSSPDFCVDSRLKQNLLTGNRQHDGCDQSADPSLFLLPVLVPLCPLAFEWGLLCKDVKDVVIGGTALKQPDSLTAQVQRLSW